MRTHSRHLLLSALLWSAPLTLHAQGGAAPSQASPPSTPMQFKGKISDVWSAETEKDAEHKDKIVLIETDQGQVLVADLGHAKSITKDVEEGAPAIVTGQMMTIEGNRRFVPANVQVGKKTASDAAKAAATAPQAKEPQRQRVSGKVVATHQLNAKQSQVDHEVLLVEVDPQTRVVVDLGPADQLKNVEVSKGDQVRVEGQEVRLNERTHGVVVADQLEAGGKKVSIPRTAIPRTGPAPSPTMPEVKPPPTPGQEQAPRQPVTP